MHNGKTRMMRRHSWCIDSKLYPPETDWRIGLTRLGRLRRVGKTCSTRPKQGLSFALLRSPRHPRRLLAISMPSHIYPSQCQPSSQSRVPERTLRQVVWNMQLLGHCRYREVSSSDVGGAPGTSQYQVFSRGDSKCAYGFLLPCRKQSQMNQE